jgi:hypothetical protein
VNWVYRKSTPEEMGDHTLLDTLPPGGWSKLVRAQMPFAANLKEACDLAIAHLILQHSGPIQQVEAAHLEATFLQPRPAIPINNDATETMPAVILERRLKWRKS